MKTVAIQGVKGAYHELAARKYFEENYKEEIEIFPCKQFKDVIAAVKRDPNFIGAMAIENTIAGSLLQNYELIRESDLMVIGEQKLHISHCLAVLPEDTMESITEVNSHPIALMQCAEFLNSLPRIKVVEGEDTASSAKKIA